MLGILTGMQAEAAALGRWADDPRVAVAVSGADADRAAAAAEALVAAGVRALLSWGLAGGLNPHLGAGTVLRVGRVLDGDDIWPTAHGGPHTLAASAGVLHTAADKARLRAATGADAVDMESGALARAAAQAGLPLHVLRAVGDPADRALPACVATALTPDGRPRILPILLGALTERGAIAGLAHARRDSRRALGALAAARDDRLAGLTADRG